MRLALKDPEYYDEGKLDLSNPDYWVDVKVRAHPFITSPLPTRVPLYHTFK